MNKIDKKAPYKGLTVKQYMRKRHPDIHVTESVQFGFSLSGCFCGFARGEVNDRICEHQCENHSSCDEVMHNDDIIKLLEGGQGVTWCDVCGDIIPESSEDDIVRVNARGKRYKTCSGTCAEKVMKPK